MPAQSYIVLNYNPRSLTCPRGYPYGEDSDGEFLDNAYLFDWPDVWDLQYSPFTTCASAQMLIKKVG